MGWFEGTILPYELDKQKNILKYCNSTMERIAKSARDKQVCCMDFLINDVARIYLKQAMEVEHAYDNARISGFIFCTYKISIILNTDVNSLVELFELHDQIFILKEDDVYKLHLTKENVHKFFLS